MIRAIALANSSINSNKIIKDQVYLVEDFSTIEKYYYVFSLDNTYIDMFRKEWFILESIHLGRLREKQIESIFS